MYYWYLKKNFTSFAYKIDVIELITLKYKNHSSLTKWAPINDAMVEIKKPIHTHTNVVSVDNTLELCLFFRKRKHKKIYRL